MKVTLQEKFIAYLVLISGLSISAVAVWYSVAGLVSIFAAAAVPIIIMGTSLEISKLVATVWLKQNWNTAPRAIKAYLSAAIVVLMLITSMGIFGFLSKAHSDQSLVSGDVLAKISVYDEKIKTAKDNIDANRKALKQMDEAVDQVMARSSSETGADKAVGLRRAQQKERARLQSEIQAEQKTVASLSEERAPIAAEVRKVEAEVGPLKYIAAFVYGATDPTILEKAVTWVIITIIVVFDPLAVILLLASQISFQNFRQRESDEEEFFDQARRVAQDIDNGTYTSPVTDPGEPLATSYEPDDGPLTDDQINQINAMLASAGEEDRIEYQVLEDADEEDPVDQYAYLKTGKSFWTKPEGWVDVLPQVYRPEVVNTVSSATYQIFPELEAELQKPAVTIDYASLPPDQEYVMVEGQNMHVRAAKAMYPQTPDISSSYIQNEEQQESGVWNRVISEAEYRDRSVTVTKTNDPKNNSNNPA